MTLGTLAIYDSIHDENDTMPEFVLNVVQMLIESEYRVLPDDWYLIYYHYLDENKDDFDYCELGHLFLEQIDGKKSKQLR